MKTNPIPQPMAPTSSASGTPIRGPTAAADDLLGDVVLGDGLGCGLVVLGGRELLAERAAHRGIRPELVRGLARLLLALRVADVQLPVARLVLAERLYELLIRSDGDQGVADAARQLGRVLLRGCDGDLRRLVREREDSRLLDRVVLAVVRLVAALPEQAHDLDRFLEH